MAESSEPVVNGLPEIKTEPADPLLEVTENPVIPKEFLNRNGLHEDSDCEDVAYFTQVEVDNTRKCLENTRLIIKDFETQLDWHLQQYMTLRNVFNKKNTKNGKDDSSKRQDLLSISQLSAIIANHPEGNKKFIKRKGPISNGAGGRKRRRAGEESESEEDTDFSDEDSEDFDEEDFEEGNDSEEEDDPAAKKTKKPRGKKGRTEDGLQVKDEIEEEIHELIEPKEEIPSDEEMMEVPVKKTPAKRGRKPKAETAAKTPAKRGAQGKKGKMSMETVDLTNIKNCKVVLNRVGGSGEVVEVKDENMDRDELIELLQMKAITSLKEFKVDKEKPLVILDEDNAKNFDYTECKTSNVVATFEAKESFPEFIFIKDLAENILNGSIKLVQADVFDEHLAASEAN